MQLFKFSLRTAFMLATLGLIAACGGGGGSTPTPPVQPPAPPPSFSVGGSISSLGNANGLTLVNGSETLVIAANANTFTFATQVPQNGTYSVRIGSQPAGFSCTVYNGSGTVTTEAVRSVAVMCPAPLDASPFTVSTFAGDDGKGFVDGVGATARFDSPHAIAKDSQGNFYVSDPGSNTIRRGSPSGVVSTLALIGGSPRGIAFDASDNLYVADARNHRVLKIPPNGVVSTLAGSSGDIGYADGPASAARFSYPQGIAVDAAGTVYVSDGWDQGGYFYHRIRKITPSGTVSTLAGSGGDPGFADGTGADARFSFPGQLTVDGGGNLYVADTGNSAIRKVTPSGVVTTVIGGPGTRGTVNFDGIGSAARFGSIMAMVFDGTGNLYVADGSNSSVRKITPSAVVSTVAGSADGFIGFVDGTGSAARFSFPTGIAMDVAGNLQVVDQRNRAIRTVTPAGVVTTLAGQGPAFDVIDGVGTAARFGIPRRMAIDGAGNVYVTDQYTVGNRIRKITPAGVVTTMVVESSVMGVAVDNVGNVYVLGFSGVPQKISPTGVVTSFPVIDSPQGFAVDGGGTVYVTSKNAVVKIASSGAVSTLAGDVSAGFSDGLAGAARFSDPRGLAVDVAGNVYVADRANNAIRRISPQGQVTTLASGGFTGPLGVAVDNTGTVYMTANVVSVYSRPSQYYFGGAVFKISSNGAVTRVAGASDGTSGHVDGPGATALFNYPDGIAVDGVGNVYVADSQSASVRKITR